MEENKKLQLDAFVKEGIQNTPLESPSKDFTKNIMGVLREIEVSESTTRYVPLISKKIWFVIAAIVAIIFVIPFQKQEGGMLEIVSIDFSFLDKINLMGVFEGLSISTTTLYGLLLFFVMILVQVYYLKGYFNKRISGL